MIYICHHSDIVGHAFFGAIRSRIWFGPFGSHIEFIPMRIWNWIKLAAAVSGSGMEPLVQQRLYL